MRMELSGERIEARGYGDRNDQFVILATPEKARQLTLEEARVLWDELGAAIEHGENARA